MIRFCDNEVVCAVYEELERSVILDYFFQDHMDKIVCVVDKEGKYKGKISYYSLINTDNIFEAVREECVVLDQKVWKNARHYFSHYRCRLNEHVMLPVVDKNGQLLCFAYEDADANREIRMLRELSEHPDALQFTDLYPEYKCVKIYEFNELAYFFAEYLKNYNIRVQVFGELWDDLFESEECLELDYRCMTIYAEGVQPKRSNWIENLLESVSVEFECIDIIYETNIKKGIFQDAEGNCGELFERLKNEKEIIIIGSGRQSQDVYNFLLKNGIDICCFVNENYGERSHRLFGKEILSSLDARTKYKNPVFIECQNEHSAWGFGGIDDYDYIGYKRNERYYLIRDYIYIAGNSLLNILRNKKIVLLGDIYLCAYIYNFFKQKRLKIIGYLDTTQQNDVGQRVTMVTAGSIAEDVDVVCLIVIPEFYDLDRKQMQNEKKECLKTYLKEKELYDFTDYFSYTSSFIEIEECNIDKYTRDTLIPKKIILGSIEYRAGNIFFRGLLDSHPSIIMINDCDLNTNLFWICIRLSIEESKNILAAFWKIYEKEDAYTGIDDPLIFNEKMEQLLELGEKFTSQELFVMFHIAFMYMKGRNILVTDIKNMVIYWEPHHVLRTDVEDCVKWLGNEKIGCDIINVVRNIVMMHGGVKLVIRDYKDKRHACNAVMFYPSLEKKDYKWGDRLVVKFEDLKLEPKKVLLKICGRWGIEWSQTLMETTCNGKKSVFNNGEYMVNGFDIKPVYNTNETYFSEFDRFRIMLINTPWQKKYGYPYLEITQFTRRELQQIFLKRFRFEDRIDFHGTKLEFKIGWCRFISNNLQKVRMIEIMGDCE